MAEKKEFAPLNFGAAAAVKTVEKVERLPDRVDRVEIDILAALKIVKHCQDGVVQSQPNTGYLLGICSQRYNDGKNILEISYSYPAPDDIAGALEMRDNLGQTAIDTVLVGWYQGNHLVELYSNDTASIMFNDYQANQNIPNSVFIMYDPFQSKHGNFVMKAFRLSDKFMLNKARNMNEYIPSNEIWSELPLDIMSTGLSSMYIRGLADTHTTKLDCNFDALSMSTNDIRIEQQLKSLYENIEETEKEKSKLISFSKFQFGNQNPSRVAYFKYILSKENANLKEGKPLGFGINLAHANNVKPPVCQYSRIEQALSLGHLEHSVDQIQDMVNTNLKNLVLNKEIQKGI